MEEGEAEPLAACTAQSEMQVLFFISLRAKQNLTEGIHIGMSGLPSHFLPSPPHADRPVVYTSDDERRASGRPPISAALATSVGLPGPGTGVVTGPAVRGAAVGRCVIWMPTVAGAGVGSARTAWFQEC